MAEISKQMAELLQSDQDRDESESAVAVEFREVLRELAGDLATTVASPSVSGIAETVRAEIASLGAELRASMEAEVTRLRDEQAALLDAVREQIHALRTASEASMVETLAAGFEAHQNDLQQAFEARLAPVVERMDGLRRLEARLTDSAAETSQAVGGAVSAMQGQVEGFAVAGDQLTSALTSTSDELSERARELRDAVNSAMPTLTSAARSLEGSQESLKATLRTYNDALDRSLSTLETKFAGILAANLERVNQRQVELESRIRDTSDRTEEAVLDLMHGNEAHHQAMVDSTATTLSQLEFFSKSFHATTSALKGIFYLSSGLVVGLVFLSYLLITGR